jgi:hypothetical protein
MDASSRINASNIDAAAARCGSLRQFNRGQEHEETKSPKRTINFVEKLHIVLTHKDCRGV